MKEGWELKKLGEVCEKITDGTHQTPKYFESGFTFLSSKNVKNRTIDWEDVKYIDEAQHQNLQKRVSPRLGDVLLAKNGTVGVAAIVDREVVFDLYVSLALLRPLYDKVISKFLWYFINSENARSQFFKRVKGIGVPNLHLKEIREVVMSLPPLSEQSQIITFLDRAFAEIDRAKANLEQNIINAEELFQSKLNELFSQRGEGWEEKKLGEVCEIRSKLVDPAIPDFAEKLHIGGGNIESGTGKIINLKSAKEEGLSSGKYSFTAGKVVLYNKIRPYLKKVAIPDFDGLCSADMYPLTANAIVITREYLFYLLVSDEFTKYAESGSDRAGIPKVNRRHLFEYRFLLPDLPFQQKAIEALNAISEYKTRILHKYQTQLQSLEELRQSLLERAFAGELT